MKVKFFTLCTGLFLAACVSYVDPNNGQDVASRVTVHHDNYKKYTLYSGPVFKQSHRYGITEQIGYLALRAGKDAKGGITYAIDVANTHFQTTWRYLNEAYDIDGNKLAVTKGKNNVNCISGTCLFAEQLLIAVSRDYLEQHKNTGIKFQVSGSNGSANYEIPAAYVQAFLSKLPF